MKFLNVVALCSGALLLVGSSAWAAKVTAVDFKSDADKSVVTVAADGPLTFEKSENAQDKQVVIELKGATLAKGVERKLDTSSFNSKVSLVSPYQVKDSADTARVVIQLREMVSADVVQDGNVLRIAVSNNGEAVERAVPAAPVPAAPVPAAPPKEVAGESDLKNFMDSNETRRFTGKPVTLQLRDAEVTDVLRLIGEASGFNIVAGDDVKGKITLSLVDVPWDQALDVVLHAKQLGAERNNNILRVTSLANLTAEKKAELSAKQAMMASAPRVTKVFQISYASPPGLKTLLEQFNAPNVAASRAGSTSGTSDSGIMVDDRTNSLIVRDTPDNVDKMKKLIEILDTQTPQVMIEAKIVEATEGFTKNMGGSLGFGKGSGGSQVGVGFNGANPVDSLIGKPGVFADGGGFAGSITNGASSLALSPSISFIPGLERLNAIINIGETDNLLKVVSAPKTVVLNKQEANILQSTPVKVPLSAMSSTGAIVATSQIQDANLSLKVTPTVTNDGNVLLNLDISRDEPMAVAGGTDQAVGKRNIKTQVVVESGSTLVIGGIYVSKSQHTSSGFPILRKIPLIGILFGNEGDDSTRTELFIFITPRILNEKEAGLGWNRWSVPGACYKNG